MVTAINSIQHHTPDSNWLDYFNPRAAIAAVIDHCDSLPSASTEEKHTLHVYTSGLRYFLGWNGDRLPTEDVLTEFIAHLKRDRGLKSNTISSKYLAPVRHYLRKLSRQHIPVNGAERDFVTDCKERLIGAVEDVKSPKVEWVMMLSPLYQFGERLTRGQLEQVYRSIERSTMKGRRDLALLYVGFTTGLRAEELRRMTLNSITPHEDIFLIRVRGKRNNLTPVPLDHDGMMLIRKYVTVFNQPLSDDDPRRITGDTPLWQHIMHGDHHAQIGCNGYDPNKAISRQAIHNVIHQRVSNILGIKVSPHDMRRTVAALARQEGMELDSIQQLLRHKKIGTTMQYIGKPLSYDASIISRKKRFAGIQDDAYEGSAS